MNLTTVGSTLTWQSQAAVITLSIQIKSQIRFCSELTLVKMYFLWRHLKKIILLKIKLQLNSRQRMKFLDSSVVSSGSSLRSLELSLYLMHKLDSISRIQTSLKETKSCTSALLELVIQMIQTRSFKILQMHSSSNKRWNSSKHLCIYCWEQYFLNSCFSARREKKPINNTANKRKKLLPIAILAIFRCSLTLQCLNTRSRRKSSIALGNCWPSLTSTTQRS